MESVLTERKKQMQPVDELDIYSQIGNKRKEVKLKDIAVSYPP